jgi:uncharacterized protein (DUF2132 family)
MKVQLFLVKCYKFATMEQQQSKDPLHGITLQKIVETLVEHYGFDTLGEIIKIKCFNENPSVKSSLTFLRKTDWARKQVEDLYIKSLPKLSSK